LNQDQINALFSPMASISFDGTTYTLTDNSGTVTSILAADLQSFLAMLNTALTTIQVAQGTAQTEMVGLQGTISAVNTFIASYPQGAESTTEITQTANPVQPEPPQPEPPQPNPAQM